MFFCYNVLQTLCMFLMEKMNKLPPYIQLAKDIKKENGNHFIHVIVVSDKNTLFCDFGTHQIIF